MIHLFAQVQAAVYSLWMLKQFMVFAMALGHLLSEEERQNIVELDSLIDRVPPVEKIIAGKKLLEAFFEQPEKKSCIICSYGEATIISTLIKRWHILGQSPEGVEDGIDVSTGQYGSEDGSVNEDYREEEEVGENWGGMQVDF